MSTNGWSAGQFDPQEMARRGRIGGYAQKARHDPRETTKAARAAFRDRFVDEVDPERVLSDAERNRRAEAALKEHMARISRLSILARKQKAKNNRTDST